MTSKKDDDDDDQLPYAYYPFYFFGGAPPEHRKEKSWDEPDAAEVSIAKATLASIVDGLVRESKGSNDNQGYVVGYRFWKNVDEQPRIRSVAWETVWPQHEPLTGVNIRSTPMYYTPGAGIYAFRDKETMIEQYRSTGGTLCGRVALWGRIEEHEWGYRARYAYPLSFGTLPEGLPNIGIYPPVERLVDKDIKELADAYSVITEALWPTLENTEKPEK